MRLTRRSRALLDLMLVAGFDALAGAACFRKALFRVGGWPSEREARRAMDSMAEKGWIVWDDSRETGAWVATLTEKGRGLLHGEMDLSAEREIDWDGKWRMMAFDLPAPARDQRHALREWLRKSRFGHLQGSVYISHRPSDRWLPSLRALKVDPSAAVFFEGRPLGDLDDATVARRSWDFDRINASYAECLRFFARGSSAAQAEADPSAGFSG